jgi:hypothetical protein
MNKSLYTHLIYMVMLVLMLVMDTPTFIQAASVQHRLQTSSSSSSQSLIHSLSTTQAQAQAQAQAQIADNDDSVIVSEEDQVKVINGKKMLVRKVVKAMHTSPSPSSSSESSASNTLSKKQSLLTHSSSTSASSSASLDSLSTSHQQQQQQQEKVLVASLTAVGDEDGSTLVSVSYYVLGLLGLGTFIVGAVLSFVCYKFFCPNTDKDL